MSSVIEICNRAITEIGGYPIQALTEQTKEAQTCSLLYAPARDEVLRAHPWNFATRRVTLALLSETYTGWTYAYQYPTDCLLVREIYDATSVTPGNYGLTEQAIFENTRAVSYKPEFEVAADSTLTSKVILTEKENAVLIYTARVTDTNMFDPLFTRALALRLAADLVTPMKGDPQMKQRLEEQSYRAIMQAEADNANECQKDPDNASTFVSARF